MHHTTRFRIRHGLGATALCAGMLMARHNVEAATPILQSGVNIQPQYCNSGNIDSAINWQLMNSGPGSNYTIWNAPVRIQFDNQTANMSLSDIEAIVGDAVAWGHSVILTYHDDNYMGSNNTAGLTEAAAWFAANYKTIYNYAASKSGKTPQIWINLMNEWGASSITSSAYASGVNAALKTLRAAGYSDYVVLDAPGYGQGVQTIAAAIKLGQITDKVIIPSVHIYPNSYVAEVNSSTGVPTGNGHSWTSADLLTLEYLGVGTPIVGEFGNAYSSSSASSGAVIVNGSSANWVQTVVLARSLAWPVFAWAWAGDAIAKNSNDSATTAEYSLWMNMTGPWDESTNNISTSPAWLGTGSSTTGASTSYCNGGAAQTTFLRNNATYAGSTGTNADYYDLMIQYLGAYSASPHL